MEESNEFPPVQNINKVSPERIRDLRNMMKSENERALADKGVTKMNRVISGISQNTATSKDGKRFKQTKTELEFGFEPS